MADQGEKMEASIGYYYWRSVVIIGDADDDDDAGAYDKRVSSMECE